LDTTLRLHPTQMPPHIFHIFLEERPINEAYQIFCLLCQSSSQVKPYDVAWMLNDLVGGQTPGSGNDFDLDIALAILNALHLYSASDRLIGARHLNILLQSSLMLLPTIGPSDSTSWAKSHMDPVSLVRQLFSIFVSLGISPETSTYNTVIAAAGRIRHEGILSWVIKALFDSGTASNEITFECLLNAAARTGGAVQVESTWLSRDPKIDLLPSTWAALARATSYAGNIDFLHAQIEVHKVSDQKSTMQRVHAELAKSQKTGLAEPPSPVSTKRHESCVAELSAALQGFQKLLADSSFGNLKENPAVRQSIWSSSEAIHEDWQKKLYEELSIDSTVLATLETEASIDSDLPESNWESQPVESPTGFRLDELRYQNWKGMNELLEHAQLFESRMEMAVNKAIKEGKPSKQFRSTKGIVVRGPRQRLLSAQLMNHHADIKRMKAKPPTETEWRDKIFELRHVQA